MYSVGRYLLSDKSCVLCREVFTPNRLDLFFLIVSRNLVAWNMFAICFLEFGFQYKFFKSWVVFYIVRLTIVALELQDWGVHNKQLQ